MAANDIFNPTDPTKQKKLADPNAPQDGSAQIATTQYGTGLIDNNARASMLGAPSMATNTQPAPINTLESSAPAPSAPAGGDMSPGQAAAAGLGWVDKNNPNYGKPGFVGSTPGALAAAPSAAPAAATPVPAAAPAADMTPQQASAAGLGWVDKNNPNYGKPGFVGSQPAAAPAPGAPAAAPGAAGAPPATVADSFKQALIAKLNPTGPIDANNAAIKPAIDANNLAEQRNFESNRNLLAERAAAHGTNNSGGFETGLMGLAQDRAQREGQFAGNAVQHLSDQQNAAQMAALGIGAQTTEGQANRDLQSIMQDKSLSSSEKMAQMDAAVRREGISSQSALGNRDADIRQMLGLLSLQQSGDQFGKTMDFNTSGRDDSTLLGLLSGL